MDADKPRPVVEFELVDHGIEHEQYFQGCGTSCTPYTGCATGVGDNPADAIEDALDSLAMDDWDVEGMYECIMDELGVNKLPKTPRVLAKHGEEAHYYFSIRVK